MKIVLINLIKFGKKLAISLKKNLIVSLYIKKYQKIKKNQEKRKIPLSLCTSNID